MDFIIRKPLLHKFHLKFNISDSFAYFTLSEIVYPFAWSSFKLSSRQLALADTTQSVNRRAVWDCDPKKSLELSPPSFRIAF